MPGVTLNATQLNERLTMLNAALEKDPKTRINDELEISKENGFVWFLKWMIFPFAKMIGMDPFTHTRTQHVALAVLEHCSANYTEMSEEAKKKATDILTKLQKREKGYTGLLMAKIILIMQKQFTMQRQIHNETAPHVSPVFSVNSSSQPEPRGQCLMANCEDLGLFNPPSEPPPPPPPPPRTDLQCETTTSPGETTPPPPLPREDEQCETTTSPGETTPPPPPPREDVQCETTTSPGETTPLSQRPPPPPPPPKSPAVSKRQNTTPAKKKVISLEEEKKVFSLEEELCHKIEESQARRNEKQAKESQNATTTSSSTSEASRRPSPSPFANFILKEVVRRGQGLNDDAPDPVTSNNSSADDWDTSYESASTPTTKNSTVRKNDSNAAEGSNATVNVASPAKAASASETPSENDVSRVYGTSPQAPSHASSRIPKNKRKLPAVPTRK